LIHRKNLQKRHDISMGRLFLPLIQTPVQESRPEVPYARGNHCARDTFASRIASIAIRSHEAISWPRDCFSFHPQKPSPRVNDGLRHWGAARGTFKTALKTSHLPCSAPRCQTLATLLSCTPDFSGGGQFGFI
jgi:hypothetical protein